MSHFFLFWISSTRDSDSRFFLENWMTFSAERCKIRLIVKSRGDKKSCNSPLSYFVYMARLKNQTRTLDFLTIVNKERTCFHLYIDASPISHFQTTLRNYWTKWSAFSRQMWKNFLNLKMDYEEELNPFSESRVSLNKCCPNSPRCDKRGDCPNYKDKPTMSAAAHIFLRKVWYPSLK